MSTPTPASEPTAATGWRAVLGVHWACALYPSRSHEELLQMGQDIKATGLRVKVAVRQVDGSKPARWEVVDGKSRLDALALVGKLPKDLEGRPRPIFSRSSRSR